MEIVQIDLSDEIVEDIHFYEDHEGDLRVKFSHCDMKYDFAFCGGCDQVIDMCDYDNDEDALDPIRYPVRIKNAVFRVKKILSE